MSYETPIYKLIEKNSNVEIRSYERFFTSSVREDSLSGNSGFSVLLSYISGDNKPGRKMAMTIPVINEIDTKKMSMEFVVPRAFYDKGIPEPNQPYVTIKEYPSALVGVISFSGVMRGEVIEKQTAKLMERLNSMGYRPTSNIRIARYNSPFSLPFLRHHEIQVDVTKI